LPLARDIAPAAAPLQAIGEPRRQQLGQGATVLSLELEEAPLVCIEFWCRAGSRFESEAESGLAHFLEHMVFKGSRRLAAGEFDRRIEALGGSSNAATGFDDVHYHLLIPPAAAAEGLELLLDLVLEPRLEAAAFDLERQVVLEELAQSEDQPDEVALQHLLSLACPDHAYGRPILGRREALLAHTPAAMAGFHERLYGANRCVLALTGALADAGLDAVLESCALTRLAALPEPPSSAPLRVEPGELRLTLPRLESARLLMAWAMPAACDLDGVMGADLATSLLAEGRRSRLVDRLREQLRIVESVDLDLHVMESGSLALLEAICEPDELPAVRQEIGAVLHNLTAGAIGPAEWQRCRHLVANGYRFSLESPAGMAGLIGSQALWQRQLPLSAPLQALDRWAGERLVEEIMPQLDPARAAVLEALPA
jgi:predicted Zn-dependent peptidase